MPDHVICNTSCLIALSSIESLGLLIQLYDTIIVPKGVVEEFGEIDLQNAKIMSVESSMARLLSEQLNLGKGEAEAIALAGSLKKALILDDRKARKVAKELDLKVTGTIGILLKAEEKGIIKSAYDKIMDLKSKGFYISDEIINQAKNRT